MYIEYNPRPISSNPVTTRTEKCSCSFPAAFEKALKELDGCVANQDKMLLFGVREAKLRRKIQCGQITAGSKELHREWRQGSILISKDYKTDLKINESMHSPCNWPSFYLTKYLPQY